MNPPSPHRRPALHGDDVLLAVLCTAAGPLLWWLGSAGLTPVSAAGLQTVELVVAFGSAAAGAVLAAWWFVALLGVATAALGHRLRSVRMVRWGQAVSPAFLRRVVASALGINLLIAPGAWAGTEGSADALVSSVPHSAQDRHPASAPEGPLPRPGWVSTSGGTDSEEPSAREDLPAPNWRPAAPAPPVPGSGHPARTHGTTPKTVTVRSGDCLWDIAAEELGPYATELEIDRRWRQWFHLNHPLIGPDADALVPGTVLQAPPIS